MAPTFFDIDISLSLRTTMRFFTRSRVLFIPSKASPPVSDPSPSTAMTFSPPPPMSLAAAIPRAAEIDVEACPTPKASYGLSQILGKPLIPPALLSVWKASRLPVKILWA